MFDFSLLIVLGAQEGYAVSDLFLIQKEVFRTFVYQLAISKSSDIVLLKYPRIPKGEGITGMAFALNASTIAQHDTRRNCEIYLRIPKEKLSWLIRLVWLSITKLIIELPNNPTNTQESPRVYDEYVKEDCENDNYLAERPEARRTF